MPEPFGAPEPVALVGRLPFAILCWHLAPGCASVHDRDNAAQDTPVVVARTPRERLLCWEEWANVFPFCVADLPLALGRQGDGVARRNASMTPAPFLTHLPCGPTAGCHRLVGTPKAGPSQPEHPLLALLAHRQNQASHFGDGERTTVRCRSPFLAVASSAPARRRTSTSTACASKHRVMKRYHAVQVRTSYWSNPTSPLASANPSSMAKPRSHTRTTVSEERGFWTIRQIIGQVARILLGTADQQPAASAGRTRPGERKTGPVVRGGFLALSAGEDRTPRLHRETRSQLLRPLAPPFVLERRGLGDHHCIGLVTLLQPLSERVRPFIA